MEEEKAQNNEAEKFEKMQSFYQGMMQENAFLIAANNLKTQYGTSGAEYADGYMNGSDVYNMKHSMHQQKANEAKKMGIAYDISMPSNGDLIMNAKKAVLGAQQELTLGNLEKIAKQFSPGLKGNTPEKFKNMTYSTIAGEIQKTNGDLSKLSEDTQDALQLYGIMETAYTKGAELALMQTSYTSELNEGLNEISEKYKPKEDTNKNSEENKTEESSEAPEAK